MSKTAKKCHLERLARDLQINLEISHPERQSKGSK
jgi:hypothetical protein